ncbi:MAG: OmpA/MotB [Hyphomicrobiales bacterium]|nr:OmpA/MotB [Hyphomicrobiales bacterium]
MSFAKHWWFEGVAVALLWIGLNLFFVDGMERDLAAATRAALLVEGAGTQARGRDILLSGVAPTSTAADEAEAAILRVPGVRRVVGRLTERPVLEVSSVEVAKPGVAGGVERDVTPYVFTARKEAGAIRLGGYFPAPSVRVAATDLLARFSPGNALIDEARSGHGAPERFEEVVPLLLAGLSRLSEGVATIEDKVVSLRGEALYENAALAIVRTIQQGLPAGYRFDSTLSVQHAAPPLDPAACQQEIRAVLASETLLFETAEAQLYDSSLAFLDRLVVTLRRCPAIDADIEGHTDNIGDAATNLDLSQRRAQAVRERFQSAGLPAERFRAVGYGETRPLVPNESGEGRARNRRIDIVIR